MGVRTTVIGTGYLGATHAACLAESGLEVLGVDRDADKIGQLADGRLPFFEPGLQSLIRRHVASGRLRFTTSYDEAGCFGDVHFLCVGTPQREDGLAADLSQLQAAIDALAPTLHRQCLVVGKCTVPVGTAEAMAEQLRRAAPADGDVGLAWNPEFLREGQAVSDALSPDRIVVGVTSPIAEKLLREVYAPQIRAGIPFVVTDLATAQLVKAAANAFLATKLSFMNAMADLCDAAGADIVTLATALGKDVRIGEHYLATGVGFGGGCLPKDIRALTAQATQLGVDGAAAMLRLVDRINLRRRTQVVDLALEACGGDVAGVRIGVLGAAFKPDSDDVRDSPALWVIGELHRRGADVAVYDPVAGANAEAVCPGPHYEESVTAVAEGAQLLLHLTEWSEFGRLDPCRLSGLVARPYLVDGRNAFDPQRWRDAGWTFRALGRPPGDVDWGRPYVDGVA